MTSNPHDDCPAPGPPAEKEEEPIDPEYARPQYARILALNAESPELKQLHELHTYLKSLYCHFMEVDRVEDGRLENRCLWKYGATSNRFITEAESPEEAAWSEDESLWAAKTRHHWPFYHQFQQKRPYPVLLLIKALSDVAQTEAKEIYSRHGLETPRDLCWGFHSDEDAHSAFHILSGCCETNMDSLCAHDTDDCMCDLTPEEVVKELEDDNIMKLVTKQFGH